jgi:hypothetical protein
MPVIVLETKGKRESIDYAKVLLFDDPLLAAQYVQRVNTGPVKYWVKAEVVRDGEEVELFMPEGPWEY